MSNWWANLSGDTFKKRERETGLFTLKRSYLCIIVRCNLKGKSTNTHGLHNLEFSSRQSSVRMSRSEFNKPNCFIPHIKISWQMCTVQAHRAIKFRFIRLISILIKTLTPPYAITDPRRLFFPHEEREMDRSMERTRAREEKGDREGGKKCPPPQQLGALQRRSVSRRLPITMGWISILCIALDCTSPLS